MITLLPFRPPNTDRWPATRVLLLIDYSNLLYQSYFSGSKGWVDRPWLPILRFMDSLRLCIQRSKVDGAPMEVIFAGESRKKLERTKMDAAYKAQRSPIDHDVFRHFRKIMALLIEDMNTKILSRDGAEADDVIASITGYVCNECTCLNKNMCSTCYHKDQHTTDVVIFTNDRDLNQLLRYDRCYIYRSPGVFYTRQNFIDEYDFDPNKFNLYKAMVGDSSDNISGVNGIGPVKAKEHIKNGTVPTDDPEFQKSLALVELDYNLDVPIEGVMLEFDELLSKSRNDILAAYGKYPYAIDEIHLRFLMLREAYNDAMRSSRIL